MTSLGEQTERLQAGDLAEVRQRVTDGQQRRKQARSSTASDVMLALGNTEKRMYARSGAMLKGKKATYAAEKKAKKAADDADEEEDEEEEEEVAEAKKKAPAAKGKGKAAAKKAPAKKPATKPPAAKKRKADEEVVEVRAGPPWDSRGIRRGTTPCTTRAAAWVRAAAGGGTEAAGSVRRRWTRSWRCVRAPSTASSTRSSGRARARRPRPRGSPRTM